MLRERAAELQQQIANLYLRFPDLVGDDEMLRVDTLEGATDLKELLSAITDAWAKQMELLDGSTNRLNNLETRRDRYQRRIAFLRAMMASILGWADVRKMELPEATLSMKRGQQKLIGDPDPDTLPDEFCRIVRDIDRAKVKQALLDGRTVDGFVLSNAEPVLTVHPK